MRRENVDSQSDAHGTADASIPISRKVIKIPLEQRNEAHKLEIFEALNLEINDEGQDRVIYKLQYCYFIEL